MYELLGQIGNSNITIPITLILIFLSYVTAADSNISAMSQLSEKKKEQSNEEGSIRIKIIWGAVIGTLTYIMVSTINPKKISDIVLEENYGGLMFWSVNAQDEYSSWDDFKNDMFDFKNEN